MSRRWMAAAACALACGGDTATRGSEIRAVELLALAPEPVVTIGVVEGDEAHQLYHVVGSVRLADGRVVVANGGSSELRFFDANGRFIRAVGGRGGGPGEFAWLTGLYGHGSDSLLAVDGAGRLSVFDTAGTFARLAALDSVSGDPTFPADVWLYRRFWVRGALTPAERRAARRVLDQLPVPRDPPAYRFAQLDAAGNVWFREPPDPSDPDARWTVVTPDGRAEAVARIPRRFEPHVIGTHTMLGRWRDGNDVEFIRRYEFGPTGATARPPAWLESEPAGPAVPENIRDVATALDALRGSLRHVVMAQETYYADHARYSPWADSLRWELPEGTILDVLAGDSRGWIGVATMVRLPYMCAMAVGTATPAGWPEGSARCSGPADTGR